MKFFRDLHRATFDLPQHVKGLTLYQFRMLFFTDAETTGIVTMTPEQLRMFKKGRRRGN